MTYPKLKVYKDVSGQTFLAQESSDGDFEMYKINIGKFEEQKGIGPGKNIRYMEWQNVSDGDVLWTAAIDSAVLRRWKYKVGKWTEIPERVPVNVEAIGNVSIFNQGSGHAIVAVVDSVMNRLSCIRSVNEEVVSQFNLDLVNQQGQVQVQFVKTSNGEYGILLGEEDGKLSLVQLYEQLQNR